MPHFDPISAQFTHQHARPAILDDVSVAELDATQRVLLTTDGTVTTLLETLALEPVHAEPCEVTPPDCGDMAAWLEARLAVGCGEERTASVAILDEPPPPGVAQLVGVHFAARRDRGYALPGTNLAEPSRCPRRPQPPPPMTWNG